MVNATLRGLYRNGLLCRTLGLSVWLGFTGVGMGSVVVAVPEDYIGSGPGQVPGAVWMTYADGKVETTCWGVADVASGRPMTADSVGWLASNTKAIACALVLSYVEEGALKLDEPISTYLPEWQGARTPTLRQLMSHTAGLEFFPKMPIDQWPMQMISRIGAKSGQFAAPGTAYKYSNWGIDVAVACVEVVAGRPWEELLRQRILDPLEMKDATFFPSEEQLGRLAKGYFLTDEKPAEERSVGQFQYPYDLHTRYPEAGGGLFGSARDMLKFFAMVANGGVGLNGRRVLKDETVAMWLEKQTSDNLDTPYSFGANVTKPGCEMAHAGAWATWGCANRATRTARVFFVQNAEGGSQKGFKEFRKLIERHAETSYSPIAEVRKSGNGN